MYVYTLTKYEQCFKCCKFNYMYSVITEEFMFRLRYTMYMYTHMFAIASHKHHDKTT